MNQLPSDNNHNGGLQYFHDVIFFIDKDSQIFELTEKSMDTNNIIGSNWKNNDSWSISRTCTYEFIGCYRFRVFLRKSILRVSPVPPLARPARGCPASIGSAAISLAAPYVQCMTQKLGYLSC
jgi:hypothetical protein